jgi:FixJ family two-component response regulator
MSAVPLADDAMMHSSSRPQPAGSAPSAIVFVVDDDVSMRESLELLMRSAGLAVQTFASGREFLACPRADVPSCLVLDVSLPGMNGLDLQDHIADRVDMPIIFVTGYGDDAMTVRAMKAGAVEFMTKPFDVDAMLKAVGSAIERSRSSLGEAAVVRDLRDRYASLSHRERQVMSHVVAGRLNNHVARELGISEITVKAHRGKVMRKMQVDSLAELVNAAARLGVGRGLSIVLGEAAHASVSAWPKWRSVPTAVVAAFGR